MEELEKLGDVPVWLLVLIGVVALCQSTWLFVDAKRRSRFPWFWGLWGLIQIPMPFIIYWIVVRKGWPRRGGK
ncbi:sigmaY antisigma factor component [Paenibacillus xanthanilyticus]|uniref:SigmaY antisigma factor component n=1 Tax=Paenibacillus xanthanilyticus TaxID=1783531 RepID=A0ABV8K4F9_9BACL